MERNTNRKIASAASPRSTSDHFSTSAKRAPVASSVVRIRLRRELVDDRGHVNERMIGVVLGEHALIRRFEFVVELFDEAGSQLFDERLRVEAREHQRDRAEQEVGVVQVGADRVVDAGVLHLHRDFEATARHRPVHLPDRRRRERDRIPLPRRRARGRRRARSARPRSSARSTSAARPAATTPAHRGRVRGCRRRGSSPSGRAS